MKKGGGIHVFALSGIPGVGKSSIMKQLKSKLQCNNDVIIIKFVKEPSKLWRQRGWLEQFYGDPNLNAAAFQFGVFDTHVDAVMSAIEEAQAEAGDNKHIFIIVERQMYDQLLFWTEQVELKRTTASQMYHEAYMGIWNKWRRMIPPVSLIFFLKTSSIQQTMERVQKRARFEELGQSLSMVEFQEDEEERPLKLIRLDGEEEDIKDVNGLTSDYQALLLKKHEEWYTTPIARPPSAPAEGIPCIHVNVDAPLHELVERLIPIITHEIKIRIL
jgi:deoxyadenosine/deoxycytidine kinase